MERNYYYSIDKEGRIWHEGTEISDLRFSSLVYRTLRQTDRGYLVHCQGENCWFRAEDTFYVVQDVNIEPERVTVIFPGGYSESLDPATLRISTENVLYCAVRNRAFPARFSRKAYLRMTALLTEDPDGGFSACIGPGRYRIAGTP